MVTIYGDGVVTTILKNRENRRSTDVYKRERKTFQRDVTPYDVRVVVKLKVRVDSLDKDRPCLTKMTILLPGCESPGKKEIDRK